MAASKETLHDLHTKIAKRYVDLLDSGEPLSPAVLAAINKFLKDNNIEALAVPDSPLDKLRKSGKLKLLPFLEDHEREAIGE